ncbi:unnamed protein product [Caenorhabditis nigoni]
MEASPDFIKENDHYLKTCILYEVLHKIPIFDSYRSFCNTVGKDAMSYPDFEFWYYRFYHGNRDLDYDRRADSESKTIMDIPVGSLTKIAGYLDPVERALLRSMNHAIKAVADTFPPVFEKIEITIMDTSMHWELNNQRSSCYKRGSGCRLSRPNSSEKSEESFMQKGLKYLVPLMKMPNLQVDHFSLQLYEETLERDDLLPIPLNAKCVHIYGQTTNQIIQFLSALNAGYLESISLNGLDSEEKENHRILFKTEQFKQATSVEFKYYWGFNVEDLANFSHLKIFKCRVSTNSPLEDVQRIRDIISTFEDFDSCELEFRGGLNKVSMREFAETLGVEIPNGPSVEESSIGPIFQGIPIRSLVQPIGPLVQEVRVGPQVQPIEPVVQRVPLGPLPHGIPIGPLAQEILPEPVPQEIIFGPLPQEVPIVQIAQEILPGPVPQGIPFGPLPQEFHIGPLPQEIPTRPLFQPVSASHRYQIPGSNKSLEFKIKEEGTWCRIEIRKI